MALAKIVAVVTVAVCRRRFQSVAHAIAIPISVVFNAARIAATANKDSKRISGSKTNNMSPRSSSATPVAEDVAVKVDKADANYSQCIMMHCCAIPTYWKVHATFLLGDVSSCHIQENCSP